MVDWAHDFIPTPTKTTVIGIVLRKEIKGQRKQKNTIKVEKWRKIRI
jgi:hypothetical protein